ncbi:TonB-dependent receptor [Pigmentiphaga litoralis]|uniref:TonB-dependent receptor n=1 Tax=Pigmentiphaga litoralis TaxID=516702 RepID=UPI0015C72A28|nr:TonB-dependent siderophore receptor [Pigmentiphaga litoralis]
MSRLRLPCAAPARPRQPSRPSVPTHRPAAFRPTSLAFAITLLGGTSAPGLVQAQAAESPATLSTITVEADAPAPAGLGNLNLDKPSDTASRLGLTPRETPASVTVVDRDAIELRGALDTQEILRAVPGITAHSAPGNIGVSYRGFNSSSVSQLFNGINVQYSIAARPVDSWIYDRVEVIGGPSSFLYGSGAVGGSINYLTKLAQREDVGDAQVRFGSYGLKEVSFGLNRRIAGDGESGVNHYARIDVNHRDANSWTAGTGTRSTQVAASLLSDFGQGLTHTLAYEYQAEHVDRPYWGTPVLNPSSGELTIDKGTRFKNYNAADGLYQQRVQWLRSITEWKATDRLKLTNTFYVYDALRDYRNVETYRYTPDNRAIQRSGAFLQRHDQQLIGDRVDALYQSTLFGRKSDWAFGADVSTNRQTRFPNSLAGTVNTVDPYQFTPGDFYQIPGTSPGFNPDRDVKIKTLAVYLENRTALLPTLNLVTALRHERIDLDLTNRRAVTAAAPASYERSYSPTTGRIGLVWDVTQDANLYVQYATAADPPSGVLSTASFADVMNNSKLTTGKQVEVGSKVDFWDRKATATLAAYHINRKNIATQDPNNSALTLPVGEQSSKGIEAALALRPTSRWAVQGNVTLVDATYDNFTQGGVSLAGKTPNNTPSFVANVWTSYAFAPAWTGIVGVRHVGRVYADAANTATWSAYTLVDVGVSWQFSKAMSLTGRIRNLTDRVYAANASSTTQVYLGAPRTADLTLRASF